MLSPIVQRFLDGLIVDYALHSNVKTNSTLQFAAYAASVNAHAIKVVLFSDNRGPLLVAFDANDGLDFEALFRVTGRNLGLDSGHKHKNSLQNFSIRHLPPFGRLFHMPMVVDQNLLQHKRYLIDIDKGDSFLEINQKSFKSLFAQAPVKSFAKSISSQVTTQHTAQTPDQSVKKFKPLLSSEEVEKRFSKGVDLPVMPQVAKELLAMRLQDEIDVDKLVEVLSTDPVIVAKLITYAKSPFFSYQGKLGTLQEAIFHVLGLDLTMNTALALSFGQEFKGPMDGAFGARKVWRHSVYLAVLTQSIATSISQRHTVNPNLAYLYALLHNIGFLALGHLYTQRFQLFNKAVSAKKNVPVEIIESKILGISHMKVGQLLVQSWGLSKVYETVIENHHVDNYAGKHEIYVHLIYLANCLLKSIDIGDAKSPEIPKSILKRYQISDAEIQNMLEIVMSWNENLDQLANQLAA